MIIRDDGGKPKATVFYIAYTADKADATRPVTFFFNGGPGSASVWLDMGIMSPRHPNMGPAARCPRLRMIWWTTRIRRSTSTDLVQVDAMMTGYSRPGVGVKATDFTGATNDIKMFGQFIRNYLDKYNRWASPKYLFGESYGTFRSAGLASELQANEGIELNGIMLLGTVLDFQIHLAGAVERYPLRHLPADVHRDRLVPQEARPPLQGQTLQQVVHQAREYAFGDYLAALAKGNTLIQAEKTAVGAKDRTAHRSIGVIHPDYQSSDRRGDFRTELLRGER